MRLPPLASVIGFVLVSRPTQVLGQAAPSPPVPSAKPMIPFASPAINTAASDLLDGNHILHFLGVVDAFGHMSVRNPDNASQFIMSFAIAPALSTAETLVTYDINNATALHLTFNTSVTGSAVPSGFQERFIHSQIFKAFPDVTSVVHAHTIEVLPFAAVGLGLKAQLGQAASIGALKNGSPIFDTDKLPTSVLPENQPHDLLIRNEVLGDALAETFVNGSQLVLMKGHGMAVRGASVRDAVFRAFYAKQSAIVQAQAILLGGLAKGAQMPTGLSVREATDAASTNEGSSLLDRAWNLWVAQLGLDADELYVNDLKSSSS